MLNKIKKFVKNTILGNQEKNKQKITEIKHYFEPIDEIM